MLGVRQRRHGAFCVSREQTLPPMAKAHFSSVKTMFTVNHEQFFIQMTQTCKHSKCLQILAGEDFQLNSSGER